MTNPYALKAILVMAAITMLLRFIPFLVFGARTEPPAFIVYLGKVLPYAIMGMLVVYCLKDVQFDVAVNWLPAFAGVGVTAILQKWKQNAIYSILAGTIVYMVFLRIL